MNEELIRFENTISKIIGQKPKTSKPKKRKSGKLNISLIWLLTNKKTSKS